MSCRLIEVENGLYIAAHKIVAVKAAPATEGEDEKSVVFVDSQSAASARFQVARGCEELVEEINACLEEDE